MDNPMQPHLFRHFRTEDVGRLPSSRSGRPPVAGLLCVMLLIPAWPGTAQDETPGSRAGQAWALLDSAWRTGNPAEREVVLGSLARVESPRATAIFRDALEHRDPATAARAASLASERRISELLPDIEKRLAVESSVGALVGLIGCLRRAHTPTAAALAGPFAQNDREPVTGVAFGVLNELGAAAVPTLVGVVHGGCAKCRETALHVLIRLGASRGENVELDATLQDPDRRIRTLGAILLAQRKQRTDATILRLGLSDPDLFLRVWSGLALYNSGDAHYEETLLSQITVPEAEQRYLAIREIVRMADTPLRDIALCIALSDPSPTIRSVMFDTYTEERYKPMVRTLLADPDRAIRLLALERLAEVDDLTQVEAGARDSILRESFYSGTPVDQQRVLSLLAKSGAATQTEHGIVTAATWSQSASVRGAAVAVLKKDGERAIPLIVPMLDSAESIVSASAADALVEISPSEAGDTLWRTMRSSKSEQTRLICAGYLVRALEVSAR
jgi:HEAT repeat protein